MSDNNEQYALSADEMTAINFYKLNKLQIEDLTGSISGYKVEGFVAGLNYKNSDQYMKDLQSENTALKLEVEILKTFLKDAKTLVSRQEIPNEYNLQWYNIFEKAEQALKS